MKIRELLKCVQDFCVITICYATNGHRMFQGTKDEVPTHLLEYYITLIIPNVDKLYIEAHENAKFMEE